MKEYSYAIKWCLLLLSLSFLPAKSWAQNDRMTLQFPAANIRDVLGLYQTMTGRPVFIDLDLDAQVDIVQADPIPKSDVAALIRKTLLEGYGIEIRDSGAGDILVSWSKDPKYPQHTKSASPSPEPQVPRKAPSQAITPMRPPIRPARPAN